MTYDEDPRRWTSSPEEAPELLRGAFSAGRNEGPSRSQMRSLALKIGAVSVGGAVAVGTVKAASAGQAAASAATWSIGKIASVVALAGTLATGGAVLWEASSPSSGKHAATGENATAANLGPLANNTTATAAAPTVRGTPAAAATLPAATPTASGAPKNGSATPSGQDRAHEIGADRPVVEVLSKANENRLPGDSAASPQAGGAGDRAVLPAAPVDDSKAQPSKVASTRARPAVATKVERTPVASGTTAGAGGSARAKDATARSSTGPDVSQSEIGLLRRAQVALRGRPREAFQLTEEHRRLYPTGEFAQERDALAIQALMRAGDSDKARDLAESFIRAYPGSPHAHRFREAMGLR